MKEKIKKIGIGIGILAMLAIIVIGFTFWKNKQARIEECKSRCVYSPVETLGGGIEGFVWVYLPEGDRGGKPLGAYRTFQTQKQCIDYCLTIK